MQCAKGRSLGVRAGAVASTAVAKRELRIAEEDRLTFYKER